MDAQLILQEFDKLLEAHEIQQAEEYLVQSMEEASSRSLGSLTPIGSSPDNIFPSNCSTNSSFKDGADILSNCI